MLSALAGGLLIASLGVAPAPASASAVGGFVRVDQVGFTPGESKYAYLMTKARVGKATFTVVDAAGHAVLSGRVDATSRGSWNAAYPAVYPMDLSRLTRPGTYRIKVGGGAVAVSPSFRVQRAADLYDAAAQVYATPTFVTDDIIAGADLTRIGGPVNVEGGWFDAGDYLKFTHS